MDTKIGFYSDFTGFYTRNNRTLAEEFTFPNCASFLIKKIRHLQLPEKCHNLTCEQQAS